MEKNNYKRLQELAGINEMASESHISEIHEDALTQIGLVLKDLNGRKINITDSYRAIDKILYGSLIQALDKGYVEGSSDQDLM